MSIEVTAVRSARDLTAFVKVPAILQARTRWTPASEVWTGALLDRRGNPYYRHAERQLLLARKDGRLAGRVAAHVDHLCNRTVGERLGTFSMLDCEPHARVVSSLLAGAEEWLRDRGVEVARGPLGPTMRLGSGLLVDGHGEPPVPGAAGNPPELPALVERAGYGRARDLTAHRIETGALPRPVAALADAVRRTPGLVLRPLRPERLAEELPRVLEVLNDLPGEGRACAPWSAAELRWTATRLAPIVDPGLVLILEAEGVPAGLGVAVRNVREALGGRGPSRAVLDALRVVAALRLRRLRSARVAVISVRQRFVDAVGHGMHALLLAELLGRLRLAGVRWAEVSLVDPSDLPLLTLLEASGAQRSKTYRIFEKRLED